MYKVFVNEKSLFLSNKVEKESNFKLFLLESADINAIIVKMFQGKIDSAMLYHPDEKLIMKTLKSKIAVEKAAGGIVYNKDSKMLFIFRNGKWDLPKGGREKGETKEQTALREVYEETGVKDLKIVSKVDKTYHIFKRNGVYKLKVTTWYKMKTNFTGKLIPQFDEGIDKAEFISLNKIPNILKNSYENIKILVEKVSNITAT